MEKITEAANWVSQKLAGPYEYKENHYQSVLAYHLQQKGYITSTEEQINYAFKDHTTGAKVMFGHGRMDIKVTCPIGTTWILELKCVPNNRLMPSYMAQLRRYVHHYRLENAVEVRGLLVIFNNQARPPLVAEVNAS